MNNVNASSLIGLLDARVAANGSAVALRQKRFGIWHETTWAELRETCRRLGAGLAATGLRPGDRLAILADASQEAVFMLLAAHYAGAVPVLIHPTLPPEETARLFAASGCKIAYCDTIDRADKILPAPGASLGDLAQVIVLDKRDAEDRSGAHLIGIDALLSRASGPDGGADPAGNGGDAIAVVTLSSGTSGPPRPLDLSHDALIRAAEAFADRFRVTAQDRSLAILPFGHPVELGLSVVLPLLVGLQPAFSESARTMQDDLIEISPTIVVGPPRLWQKLRGDVVLAAHRTGFLRRRLFGWAMGALEHPTHGDAGRSVGLAQRLLVTGALRARFGLGRTRVALSTGGAPVPAIWQFFARMTVSIQNAYCVSEAGGIVAMLDADVLAPLSGFDVRVDDGGAIDVQAAGKWVATGDQGKQAAGGITLLGRAEERLPPGQAQSIESALKADPLIREAVVLPDEIREMIAIVQPDPGQLGAWANRHQLLFTNLQSLVDLPEVQQILHEVVSAAIAGLPADKRPSGFVLWPRPLGLESGELTPMMAARRPVLAERVVALKEQIRSIGG